MAQRKKTNPKKSKSTESSAKKKTSPALKHKNDKDELWDEELGHVTGGIIVSPRSLSA